MFAYSKYIAVILVCLSAITTGALASEKSTSSALAITEAWTRDSGGRTISGAIYLKVSNKSDQPITITGVSTPAATRAEIHRSFMENNIMRMAHQAELVIGAGSDIAFKPGGYHIMLMQLTSPLKEGETITFSLSLKDGGTVSANSNITSLFGPKAKSTGPHTPHHKEQGGHHGGDHGEHHHGHHH